MNSNIEYIKKEKWKTLEEEIFWSISNEEIREDSTSIEPPKYGDIWICTLPILVIENNTIIFQTQNRPILIIDDTKEHFIKKDFKNYYGLKITTQKDTYHRIELKNYQKLGLHKKSYIRIELPIKIEREQLLYKISSIEKKQMDKYLKLIMNYIQIQL